MIDRLFWLVTNCFVIFSNEVKSDRNWWMLAEAFSSISYTVIHIKTNVKYQFNTRNDWMAESNRNESNVSNTKAYKTHKTAGEESKDYH